MYKVLPINVLMRALVLVCAALAASSSTAFAQRGGGRGGGGGGGGGRGGGGGGGSSVSETAMQRIRAELKLTDELEFLDKRHKQLSLDKAQKDTLKQLKKEMGEVEKPIFKEMEKTFADVERTASQGGGRGGGRDGGDDRNGRGGFGGMPPGIREMVVKLTDIQASFGERALVFLADKQKLVADSLRPIYKDELREKADRSARSRGMGGRGR